MALHHFKKKASIFGDGNSTSTKKDIFNYNTKSNIMEDVLRKTINEEMKKLSQEKKYFWTFGERSRRDTRWS